MYVGVETAVAAGSGKCPRYLSQPTLQTFTVENLSTHNEIQIIITLKILNFLNTVSSMKNYKYFQKLKMETSLKVI